MKTINIFVSIFGSYYHFMTESALGLYELLEHENLLTSLDCNIYYQGAFKPIVQYFSSNPVIEIPDFKPHLQSIQLRDTEIITLKHKSLNKPEYFKRMINLSNFLMNKTPYAQMESGITIIKRTNNRHFLETEILAEKLTFFGLPVRVVSFENMPFADQINMARNTLLLIAPHGAGTINMMFMPKGGRIIELFPMGFENWHAAAMAKVFGHKLVEIESRMPGEFGRPPTDEIRKFIADHGWPKRSVVREWRKRKSPDLHRVVRDVKSYSIDPDLVMAASKNLMKDMVKTVA